jgi:hypothetical protein
MEALKLFASSVFFVMIFSALQAIHGVEEEKKDTSEMQLQLQHIKDSEGLQRVQAVEEVSLPPSKESLACYEKYNAPHKVEHLPEERFILQ